MPVCRDNTSPVSPRSYQEECLFSKKYYGSYSWNQDQTYEGEFFRGCLHGEGTYKWKDLGVYEGGFYSNYKEGYAVLSFPDNSCFEGLFVRNQRFGPGIFTYSNGRQDAGFWKGQKLVRLSRSVDFIIPRLAPTSAAKIKLLQFRRLIPVDEDVCNSFIEIYNKCDCPSNYLSCPYSSLIFDPESYFFDKEIFEKTYFLNSKEISDELLNDSEDWEVMTKAESPNNDEEQQQQEKEEEEETEYMSVPSHCLCEKKEFVMKYQSQASVDICKEEYSKGDVEMGILAYFSHYNKTEGLENKEENEGQGSEEEEIGEMEEQIKRPKILAWNRSELCILMLQQMFRFRAFEGKLTFNLAKLILGARTAFRKTGEKEKQCLEFLRTCATGPPQMVKAMLCKYDVSEELTDSRGNNSVMFAAATDQREIIDILTNYGVDVNSFNDESLTPLNLCLLRRLAQGYNLGDWETAFLPKEMEKTDDDFDTREWRKRISIPSLDRIFGDGTSMHEPNEPHPCESFKGKGSAEIKSKSLVISQSSSTTAMPMMSKSLYNTVTLSIAVNSESLAMRGVQIPTKTKSEIRPKIFKTEEFEKCLKPSSEGSYFFELGPQKLKLESEKKESWRPFRRMNEEEEDGECEEFLSSGMREKILEIDKTIEKLLKQGADPNLPEVPKPSIHLGVYTKNSKIVHLLLSYGANPNSRLYSNEGLLTPLHALVLLKSALEYVDICDLLLNFGANTEEETLPEFVFYKEEKPFLDLKIGRTPLQLLCMRPDLEYADPEGNLIKIALMLAKACNKTRFYKGYSYLAIAMCFGNLKLLKALLDSHYFDPNILLGNDMGTILHVLVSTDFQKKTLFDTSIQICDYLLDAKANPLKHISQPEKLVGNCIDYGYREIDAEKASRIVSPSDKKDNVKKGSEKKSSKKTEKLEKPLERDHLPDHIKLMEYLCKRVGEMKYKKRGGKSDDKNKSTILTVKIKSTKEEGNENKLIKEQKPAFAHDTTIIDNEKEKDKSSLNNLNDLNEFELKKGNDLVDDDDDDDNDETKRKNQELESDAEKKSGKKNKNNNLKLKDSDKAGREKLGSKKAMKKTDSNLSKLKLKSSLSKAVTAKQPCHSENFPENLRRSVLKLLFNCTNLDINELLLPYVVLRDGDLYYSLKGKGPRGKEQYSLV